LLLDLYGQQSRMSAYCSIGSGLFHSLMPFEVSWRITNNFDPSIIPAFLKVWGVSSWFMKMGLSVVLTLSKSENVIPCYWKYIYSCGKFNISDLLNTRSLQE
jgi:hypothetical protein